MKPTPSDLRFWEAAQARSVPAWALALDAKRIIRSFDSQPRAARLAALVHEAINSRAGFVYGHVRARPKLDQRNAISLLVLVRKNQARSRANGYWACEPDGSSPPKTLAEYMRRCTCERRAPYYRRWLRRLSK